MKAILYFLLLLVSATQLVAQAPQSIPYQAVVRNSSGKALTNQAVKVRFSIRESIASGAVVYQETQAATANAQGLVNVNIGQGAAGQGSFAGINWGTNNKFIQTEIDIAGGSNFTDFGTTQFMSVPYALQANNGMPNGKVNGEMLFWKDGKWVSVKAGTPSSILQLNENGEPTWVRMPNIPLLVTYAPQSIGQTSAVLSGQLVGGSLDAMSGIGQIFFCYSTNPNPKSNGDGSGIDGAVQIAIYNWSTFPKFSEKIINLKTGTTYYVRIGIVTTSGLFYGNEQVFTTKLVETLPNFEGNTELVDVDFNSASLRYSLGYENELTARGVCWSTAPNPTIYNYKTYDGIGTGRFTVSLPYLIPNTTYYARSYATNSIGTSYGTEINFTTSTVPKILSVAIGTQVWTTKNLDITTYRNGDPIPQVTDQNQWANLTTGAWCWYNNDSAKYAATYGKLYNLYAVNDSRGLAPAGWHIPNPNEWTAFISYLGGRYYFENAIKEVGPEHWLTNMGASNSSGFYGLPGGYRQQDGYFYGINSLGSWATTSSREYQGLYNCSLTVLDNISGMVNVEGSFNLGFSVRCIKDTTPNN